MMLYIKNPKDATRKLLELYSSAGTKGGRILKPWGKLMGKYWKILEGRRSPQLGHLCLLIVLIEVTLPQRLGDRVPIFPDDCISKEWLPGP